ncbi:MAG: SAVED domain-containing protein [Candidatus Peribacter sp.]|jgi:hypothetical protein
MKIEHRKVTTRDIKNPVKYMLWGRAAGRCEFSGCNKPLWKSSVTQDPVNIAQNAHIYAFSEDGPRSNKGISKTQLNDFANLLLICHECHRNIDVRKDGGRYTVALLQQWKSAHERRIEIVTGIVPTKRSSVLLYGVNIGAHSSPLNFVDAASALFPRRYPDDNKGIELGLINSSQSERDASFWKTERENLEGKFDRRVKERIAKGEVDHLSVFGLAPQPLLILLGSLMIDITRAEVFQLHREPGGWAWPSSARALEFSVQKPSTFDGPPALVLSLSATVTPDRITDVLGEKASIWTLTIPKPNNDFVKSRQHLAQVRTLLRPLLDEIKAHHGQRTPLHIFPAAPVSLSIELGRIRMPKADMPWEIYDQVGQHGFIPALTIA